ncbi:MAG: hypothetical protein IJK04_13305 [Kiritimatiellae bacterium]|nr:hypothetical protein [Kiritimatiellia bacterium]
MPLSAAPAEAVADIVNMAIVERDKPDAATLLSYGVSLSNSTNLYRLTFANKRAHGNAGRLFKMRIDNGLQNGFSGLISAFGLKVNGIDAERLQLAAGRFGEWTTDDGGRGIKFTLNFDGAWVDIRFWMRPDSPVLFGEVAPSEGARQLSAITNAVVRITSIPSFLECGKGRKTRFFGYARQVRTAARLLELPPNRTEPIVPGDGFFIMQDADYDGSDDSKGMGPSATWPLTPGGGRITLNDSWTTAVEYRPDLLHPFRFALLEFKSRRLSNEDIFSLVRSQ